MYILALPHATRNPTSVTCTDSDVDLEGSLGLNWMAAKL